MQDLGENQYSYKKTPQRLEIFVLGSSSRLNVCYRQYWDCFTWYWIYIGIDLKLQYGTAL